MTNALVLAEKAPIKTKDSNVNEHCVAMGRRLMAAIEDAELTQADVARLIGKSRSAVNWWVQGLTYPSIEHSIILANLLRVTPEYLMYGVVNSKKDRLVEHIPVYDTHVRGVQTNITQIGLPKDFIARTKANPDALRGVAMQDRDSKMMITIADTSDKEVTAEPKSMLVDFGDGSETPRTVEVSKKNKSITIEMPGSGQVIMNESDFKKRNLVIGHVIAELHSGRA